GLVGGAEGGEGLAQEEEALRLLPPAAEDDGLESQEIPGVRLLAHELDVAAGEVVQAEVGQELGLGEEGIDSPGAGAADADPGPVRAGRLAELGEGLPAVEVGGVAGGDDLAV